MKHLTLKYLRIKNFAGITNFEHAFGNDVEISGQNGTGKTSIGNAISWLLTGKDLEGKSDFGIKPRDKTGSGANGLITEVEGTFQVDGKDEHTLHHSFQEKWETIKGGENTELVGHEHHYSIDGTWASKKEYYDLISSEFEGQVLPLILTPHAFNNLHWKVRRELLFDMIDLPTDYELASKHWKALVNQIENQDLDNVQRQMKKEQKEAKDKIWEYGIRSDELANVMDSHDFVRSKRAEHLENQRFIYMKKQGACQQILDEIEELLNYKAELIQKKLAKVFPEVEFKMFEEQLNGELKATCETMWHGRSWDELSAGEKISVGLRIVQSLQRHYNFKAPVIIDEHESVAGTRELPLPELDCQVIRLYHVPNKELEVSYA